MSVAELVREGRDAIGAELVQTPQPTPAGGKVLVWAALIAAGVLVLKSR